MIILCNYTVYEILLVIAKYIINEKYDFHFYVENLLQYINIINTDVDECVEISSPCSFSSICSNSRGSYQCIGKCLYN